MKHAILLSAVPVDAAMKRYCRPGNFVVACDAGYRNSDCLGVHPDLIVGDFDSAPQPDTDSDTIVLPHVKDDTDTHYAAKWLLENGYTQVTMLGALGGARLEHTIANLSTGLFLAEHGVDVVLADTASEIHYLVPGKDLTLQRGEWQYLSVFPWDGKLIGVDVDQSANIAEYAGEDGLTVTSAMKGLYPTTYDTLTDVVLNGNWDNYKGKIATLGLVSGDDPTANYVQIPMETTQWEDGKFTQDDYKAMVKDMFDGKITVSNDTGKAPADFATVISVDDQGAIKG